MKKNKFYLVILILMGVFLINAGEAFCQTLTKSKSSFHFEKLSAHPNVGVLTYDGTMASVAENYSAFIPKFEYLSIGKIKLVKAVANGCLLVVMQYQSQQIIALEANMEIEEIKNKSGFINEWSIGFDTEKFCRLSEEIKLKKSRYSATLKLDNGIRVHLINIKDNNIELFKYMAKSVSFPSGT